MNAPSENPSPNGAFSLSRGLRPRSILSIDTLTKIYPNSRGVRGVSLTISKGEHFALMGRSGSGKSTLLRLIAGLEKPDSGGVSWNGVELTGLPPHERGLAFVPQKVVIFPHLNVFENLALPLRVLPRKVRPNSGEITRRVQATAERLRIEKYLKNRPFELSGGEQQRLALGRAMIREAKLWLLDEPFAGLDPPLQNELSQELDLLRRALDLTIISITHDLIDVMASADRIGLLDDGRLLQTGTPAEVYARPSNLTVGFLFGHPQMNLIHWTSQREENHRKLTLGIRPECLSTQGGMSLGTATILDCRPVAGSYWFTALIDGQTKLKGVSPTPLSGQVELYAKEWCWFDSETGERIDEQRT